MPTNYFYLGSDSEHVKPQHKQINTDTSYTPLTKDAMTSR